MIRGSRCVVFLSSISLNGTMVSRKSNRVICMGLKTSSLSMMKKVVFLLVSGQNLNGHWFRPCEVWKVYLLFNICMFCILFVCVLVFWVTPIPFMCGIITKITLIYFGSFS